MSQRPQVIPPTCKALQLERATQKGQRNEAKLHSIGVPEETKGMVLVKMTAAGFNQRDEWVMQGLYPGLLYENSTIGCDGVGRIVRGEMAGDDGLQPHPEGLVLLVPTRGWLNDPDGPEASLPGSSESKLRNSLGGVGFGILGSTRPTNGVGTFVEYCQVESDMIVNVPAHLNSIKAACLPCGGVTAFRALFTKAKLQRGENVLITGIGGGVALIALQFAVAIGANVFVTGGTQEKVDRAIFMGAKGGLSYREQDWPKRLGEVIQVESPKRPFLDIVIDSAGGNVIEHASSAKLKCGGKIVCYGMTAVPQITFSMREVLRNYELLGTTMGSADEFRKMILFVDRYKIVPVVDSILYGLQKATHGFPLLQDASKRSGGKVIVSIDST